MTTKDRNLKPLSPRQRRFCEQYISCDSPAEACVAAGYSPKGAGVQANRLLKNASVQAEITRRQEEAARRADVKEDDVIQMLVQVRDQAREANQFGPCVRAIELLGKKLGMFADKHLIGGVSEHTDEEIAAGLARAISAAVVSRYRRCVRPPWRDQFARNLPPARPV